MEVTAFIIELSAEVVKGMQGGNECWMGNNEKLRGEGRRDGCAFERVGADAKQQSVHLKARVIVRGEAVDVLFERVVGMERLVGVKQSLRLDGKKVCNI